MDDSVQMTKKDVVEYDNQVKWPRRDLVSERITHSLFLFQSAKFNIYH